ncbi:MAG: T9SS type A sorting domain-containing protein, partial [Ferruginibacter sp.]
ASNTFTNLAAGNYTGYVKDAAGCVGTKAMTVNAAAPITVSTLVKNASSCANDGSIEVYRSGGISPYTYSLDNVTYVTNNKFFNLAAGSYTVYVKDSKGCIGSQAVSVSQGVGVSVTASKTNTSTCVNDGTIQVNAAGGVGPYSYKLNSGSYQPSSSFTGLTNTSYVVTVKDSKGCLGTINVTINLNPIVVTKTSVNASSCASTNGSIQLFRTGGVGPYTYSIDGNTYQVSNSFNGLAPGTYDGYVKDSKTCIGVLSNIVVGPSCGPRQASKNNVEINYEKVKVINSRISAYPNPSSTEFTLMLENASNAKVSINVTDVLGVKVYEASGNRTFKFGKEFKAGMYIVNVIQGTAKQSIKVVKE